MLSSSVRTFTHPDEYAAAATDRGTITLTLSERGIFRGKLTHIHLHRLQMRRLSDNLARTIHADLSGEMALFALRTRPGPSIIRNGGEITSTRITRAQSAENYYQRSIGDASFGNMLLPLDEIASLGEAVVGCDLMPPDDDVSITPSRADISRLLYLHAAAGQLAEDMPAVLADPGSARGLEQSLIEAMMHCLGGGEVQEDRAALRQHAAIMRRFHRAIEQQLDQPLYIAELCKEVGASERTLRICCHEHLGMGPKRYLLLRRMTLMRQALHENASANTTVTEIAARYGFWQFGRLAGEYKSLFGELPSVTLARPLA